MKIQESDPDRMLFEHIMKGDLGDGIPNALSDDDTFVVSEKRQKNMTQKRINNTWEGIEPFPPFYERNKKLISLFEIPDEVKNNIMDTFNELPKKSSNKLLKYFQEKGLRNLLERVSDV